MVRFISIFVFVLSVQPVFAESLDTSIRQNFMSARALGMGNAYTAMADDYNTLLMNPAGLARLDTWQLNMSTEYAAGLDFQSVMGSINANQGSGNNATDLTNSLTKLSGTKTHLRTVPMQGFLVRPGFGMAFVPVDVTADIGVPKTGLSPSLEVSIYADTTAAMGIARDAKVGNGRFSWGVTGKLIHRVHMDKNFIPIDLMNSDSIFSNDDANEGLTIDADIGVLWTPKLPRHGMWRVFKLAKPTFGAVARNALNPGFFQNFHTVSEKTGKPPAMHRTLDLGSKWEYPKMWIFRSRGLLDFRDIGHPNWNLYKGLHLGWELAWKMYDWWKGYYRFGINQGYITAGFSARLGIWNLDIATWGEEVGRFNSRKENRRIMAKFNIEI